MRLLEEGAGHGHLGVCEARIPARLLLLHPAPDALAIGPPSRRGDVVATMASSLAERKHPPALALAGAGQQGVELGAQGLADRGRDGHALAGQLVERVAETVAQACTRAQLPHTTRRAVKAIGQDAADAIQRLLLARRLVKLAVRLGKRRRTGGLGVAQVPEDTPTDHRGHIDLARETAAVLLIRQDIRGPGEPTPRQARPQTVVAERTDQAIERQRREVIEHRTPLQAQSAMGRHQGSAGDLRAHLAVAQDERRQDRDHGFACRALEPPDGEPTQTDAHLMRVARQAPPSATGRLVLELKAKRQPEGEDTLEQGLAITEQLKVGRFVLEIKGDSAVCAGLASGVAHGSPSGQMVVADADPRWGYDCTMARGSRKVSGLHHSIEWNVETSRADL